MIPRTSAVARLVHAEIGSGGDRAVPACARKDVVTDDTGGRLRPPESVGRRPVDPVSQGSHQNIPLVVGGDREGVIAAQFTPRPGSPVVGRTENGLKIARRKHGILARY